ncbi:Tol biopolymer transport system component [Paraburkholderia rhizosphaerae]|uniref:Tol biopolymer transport system component n=1 Tax=Paraburkholderia rhizosphaerae TaxID=480658 RepID=A0A4R8LWJ8_9BURK|nr:Tol biopolymer transport system component [Paraburkholderia rhizosphaerae]
MRLTSPALRIAAAGFALSALAVQVQAACVNSPADQSSSTLPSTLTGKLAYHSYVSYGDGTSQLFIYDFTARTLTQVSKSSWGIKDPMNAVFSPDGKWIAFMGVTNNAWNVFIWQVGSTSAPINMTNSTGQTRNEDPKFSSDGSKLFFKQNGDVMEATLSFTSGGPQFTSVVDVTNTAPGIESSMPFPSPDSSAVYFATGTGAGLGLYKETIATHQKVAFDAPQGLQTYYPMVRKDGTVFYARWLSAASQLDQIYSKVNPGDTPNQLSINDCRGNNSDPAPVDNTNYLFMSSTTDGGYQLYLADVSTGKRWNLSQLGVNSDKTKAKLGSNYWSGTTTSTPGKTLLSQGKPATASSSYNSSLTADKAFDGNTSSTRWDSIEGNSAGTQWITVDLGAVKTVTAVDLYWDAGASAYQIQTSNDNANWTTIYSTSSGVGSGHVSLANLKGSGRYVRMFGTKRATPWGYSLDEMQVWGS